MPLPVSLTSLDEMGCGGGDSAPCPTTTSPESCLYVRRLTYGLLALTEPSPRLDELGGLVRDGRTDSGLESVEPPNLLRHLTRAACIRSRHVAAAELSAHVVRHLHNLVRGHIVGEVDFTVGRVPAAEPPPRLVGSARAEGWKHHHELVTQAADPLAAGDDAYGAARHDVQTRHRAQVAAALRFDDHVVVIGRRRAFEPQQHLRGERAADA